MMGLSDSSLPNLAFLAQALSCEREQVNETSPTPSVPIHALISNGRRQSSVTTDESRLGGVGNQLSLVDEIGRLHILAAQCLLLIILDSCEEIA